MSIPVKDEQEWAKKFPVPDSTTKDKELSLWNYPVAKTDLPPEHRIALKKFLAKDLHVVMYRSIDVELIVRGHASDSGDESSNIALSRDRAQKVARFLVSEGFPSAQIHVEWAGANEPATMGSSGYAAMRNRRVDVVLFVPQVKEPLPPIGTDPSTPESDSEPGFKIPKETMPSSLTIDIPLDIPLPPIKTAEVVLEGRIGGVLKLKVDDKGGGWGGGLAIKDGKLTAKFEKKILDELKGKVSFEPKSPGKDAVLKVGGETQIGTMDTTVGLQTKLPHFVYTEFSFEAIPMPAIDLGDVHVTMSLKPTLKIEVGPGPAILGRLGITTAGTVGAAVAGSVVGSALLIVGTAKTVEYAKEESIRYTRLLALRSGVAARVAFEIVGNTAEVDFKEQRQRWIRTLDQMGSSFDTGVESVNALLRKGEREKLRADWDTKYAQGSQIFSDIHPRVFEKIGNYEKGDDSENPASRL